MKKLTLMILVISMITTSCTKKPDDVPTPTKQTTEYHFKIEGATTSSQLIYHNKSFVGSAQLPLPEFTLQKGDFFQFLDDGDYLHPNGRTITIYMNGQVLQKWTNTTDRIRYQYTVQ